MATVMTSTTNYWPPWGQGISEDAIVVRKMFLSIAWTQAGLFLRFSNCLWDECIFVYIMSFVCVLYISYSPTTRNKESKSVSQADRVPGKERTWEGQTHSGLSFHPTPTNAISGKFPGEIYEDLWIKRVERGHWSKGNLLDVESGVFIKGSGNEHCTVNDGEFLRKEGGQTYDEGQFRR